MYFQIQINRRFIPSPPDWEYWEDHPALWTARNRIRVMIADSPDLKGRLRVVSVTPLDGVNREFA